MFKSSPPKFQEPAGLPGNLPPLSVGPGPEEVRKERVVVLRPSPWTQREHSGVVGARRQLDIGGATSCES